MSTDDDSPTLWLLPGYDVISMQGAVQLRAGDEQIHRLESDDPDLVQRLLEMLQRGARRRELVEAATGDDPLVTEMLEALQAEGMLLDQAPRADDEVSVYLLQRRWAAGSSSIAPPRGVVDVIGGNPIVSKLVDALIDCGIDARARRIGELEAIEDGDAAICAWEDARLVEADETNHWAIHVRRPCLFLDLSHGSHATLGPFRVPGEGSCYNCFRQRLRQNTAALAEFDSAERWRRQADRDSPRSAVLPWFRYQAAGWACGEVFAFLSGHRALQTLNRAVTVDFERMTMWSEPAWRIPWCSVCGAAE